MLVKAGCNFSPDFLSNDKARFSLAVWKIKVEPVISKPAREQRPTERLHTFPIRSESYQQGSAAALWEHCSGSRNTGILLTSLYTTPSLNCVRKQRSNSVGSAALALPVTKLFHNICLSNSVQFKMQIICTRVKNVSLTLRLLKNQGREMQLLSASKASDRSRDYEARTYSHNAYYLIPPFSPYILLLGTHPQSKFIPCEPADVNSKTYKEVSLLLTTRTSIKTKTFPEKLKARLGFVSTYTLN